MPRYLEEVEMVRLTVRIPTPTLDEIDKHISVNGLLRGLEAPLMALPKYWSHHMSNLLARTHYDGYLFGPGPPRI
jgi:hypothetical protein